PGRGARARPRPRQGCQPCLRPRTHSLLAWAIPGSTRTTGQPSASEGSPRVPRASARRRAGRRPGRGGRGGRRARAAAPRGARGRGQGDRPPGARRAGTAYARSGGRLAGAPTRAPRDRGLVRVAALYDVHGMAVALEAVLAEVGDAEVDAILL